MFTKLPTLFSRASTGALREWTIEVSDCGYRTHSGVVGGKITTSDWYLVEATNVGRANERTVSEQALFNAKQAWKKKTETGYFEDASKVDDSVGYVEPMLAKKWEDRVDKVVFPVYCQPKLDGCLSKETVVLTDKGEKTLEEVFSGEGSEILSFDFTINKAIFKPIIGRYLNGIDIAEYNPKRWFELKLSNGKKIKVTGNHRFYLPRLSCWRRADQLKEGDIFMESPSNLSCDNKFLDGDPSRNSEKHTFR